jgi:hypothetical protein
MWLPNPRRTASMIRRQEHHLIKERGSMKQTLATIPVCSPSTEFVEKVQDSGGQVGGEAFRPGFCGGVVTAFLFYLRAACVFLYAPPLHPACVRSRFGGARNRIRRLMFCAVAPSRHCSLTFHRRRRRTLPNLIRSFSSANKASIL